MPLNRIKTYNSLLDLYYPSEHQNKASLKGVFNRDFIEIPNLQLKGIPIHPTHSEDGEDSMDRLFRHLITVITDEATRKREFDSDRAVRIHWIRFLIEGGKINDFLIFNIKGEDRVYLLDKNERYVIVLEPKRKVKTFYLLTGYRLEPSRFRNLMNKYEKRGKDGIPDWMLEET